MRISSGRNTAFHFAGLAVFLTSMAGCGGGGGGNDGNGAGSGTPATYSIGGAVTGLNGAGLVLQNNGANDLTLSANGSFTFSGSAMSGASYNITVKTQPVSAPAQTCTASNASGTVGNGPVTTITINCRNLVGHFVYVANTTSGDVSAYVINPSTGALTAAPGSPFAAAPAARLASADPAGKFLYVTGANSSQAWLSAYSISSMTGALTAVSGSPYSLALGSAIITSKAAVHPSGGFLYVPSGNGASSTYGFSINQTTGQLTPVPGSPYSTGSTSQTGTFDASGKFFYVPSAAGLGVINQFQVDATNGALSSLGSVLTGGGNPAGLSFHPTGKFAYVPNAISNSVAAFSVNATTGVLTTINGSPYATGPIPLNTAFGAGGNFFYVSNIGSAGAPAPGSISAFAVDASSGALTPLSGSPVATGGNNAQGILVYPDGKYLLVNNIASTTVSIFGVNASTGALTPAVGSPFATGLFNPGRVIIDPSGRFAYLTSSTSNTITAFSIDASAGTITVVGSYPTGTGPTNVPEIVGLQ